MTNDSKTIVFLLALCIICDSKALLFRDIGLIVGINCLSSRRINENQSAIGAL